MAAKVTRLRTAPTRILRTAAEAFLDTIARPTPAVPTASPSSRPSTRSTAPAPTG